jgi:hypothetical protein
VTGVTLTNNAGCGLQTAGATGQVISAKITACVADASGDTGFIALGVGNSTTFIGCTSKASSYSGFELDSDGSEVHACTSLVNADSGFLVGGADVQLLGPEARGNGRSGIATLAAATRLTVTGGQSRGNGQHANATYIQVDLNGVDTRITGHVSDAGTSTNRPARGFQVRSTATGARLYGCHVRGTFSDVNFQDDTGNADVFPALGIAKPGAISTPTAPSATYVQAQATAMKTTVDAIRAALTARGITL